MFMILAVILVLMWLGGFVMFKSAGLLIHLLLLFAVISLILHFVTGRRTV
ncbi:MAG TPA: lmo0937 family membrane protein [Acidobacteriaceae bacterium]